MKDLIKKARGHWKIHLKKSLLLIAGVCVTVSCDNSTNSSLDIKQYLSQVDEDGIYPSVKQIAMLREYVPENPYQPGASIEKRDYWSKITNTESGKEYIDLALKDLEKLPEVPISDSIYRLANKLGDRGMYKPRYYRTMDRLERFIIAECLENMGRFLPQIHRYSHAILAMKSWVHPNHDYDNNGVLEGRRVSIDLGARKFGSVLALAEVLLGDKLDQELRDDITNQLQWRIIDSYLVNCKVLSRNNNWIKSTSNWNSVCTSGALFVSLAISKDKEERIAAIGSALNSMKYYLSGFGDDGYCSEGLGYWGYGFGHYLYIAQMVYDYTEGGINLFEGEDPVKLKNVGNFPEMFEIQNGRCAPFADGVSSISKKGSNFAYVLSAKEYGAVKPTELRLEEAVERLMAWSDSENFTFDTSIKMEKVEFPDYSYFDDFGMVISRGKQENPFSIAIKAGHNAENHNHSDVGTYSIVLGSDVMTGDIGAPSYMAGSFSKTNKARSSWGHPVPIIDGKLQSNGREFAGTITSTSFTSTNDKITMDLIKAYEIESLKSLVRTMENDKQDNGTITIQDSFTALKPVVFGVPIMTLSAYEIVNSNTVILTTKHQKIKAEVFSKGGIVKITDELVPVKHLRERGPAYKIGINFIEAMKEGQITIKFSPVVK